MKSSASVTTSGTTTSGGAELAQRFTPRLAAQIARGPQLSERVGQRLELGVALVAVDAQDAALFVRWVVRDEQLPWSAIVSTGSAGLERVVSSRAVTVKHRCEMEKVFTIAQSTRQALR